MEKKEVIRAFENACRNFWLQTNEADEDIERAKQKIERVEQSFKEAVDVAKESGLSSKERCMIAELAFFEIAHERWEIKYGRKR